MSIVDRNLFAEVKMAQKVTVSLQDDLDGSPAAETVHFALAGSEFEIDLSAKNARAFRREISPFLEHARRAGRISRTRAASRGAASRARSARIRAWARNHGMTVSERGRIPVSVIERYQASTKRR